MTSVHSDAYRVVTKALKNAREQAGLTQQDLARRLIRPQSFVAKYELGERRLDVVEFVTIAPAIGVDPIRLFSTIAKSL
jgi:transcriptional regulator with XRE-family HTH domain